MNPGAAGLGIPAVLAFVAQVALASEFWAWQTATQPLCQIATAPGLAPDWAAA